MRCPASHNNRVSGSGRLRAASDATGHKQGERKNAVAQLRKQQYFSSRVWAGSETLNVMGNRQELSWYGVSDKGEGGAGEQAPRGVLKVNMEGSSSRKAAVFGADH